LSDVTVAVDDAHVATVEIHRPPANYFDAALIKELGDAYEAIDADPSCRVIVLCSEGKHFCAGANLGAGANVGAGANLGAGSSPADQPRALYRQALRLFAAATPVVAAVQGAAVGGGLGLALSADFRVASPSSRFSANFARLGFHHGFGLSVTLPALAGQQAALDLLLTGRRVPGEEAMSLGLCDRLVEAGALRPATHALADELARSAPLAVRSIRATLRSGLLERVEAALELEASEQDRLRATEDFREGVIASLERRMPRFDGR
jgi:enoyl-CoA hydratase/carnithine racemase